MLGQSHYLGKKNAWAVLTNHMQSKQSPREEVWGRPLTNAAQALLPDTHQHEVAEVAVSGLLEMLQRPGMPPVSLGVLQG